jgi:hypothetical protein
MAKGSPKTVCRHRKFGWLRGESKLFMQKLKVAAGTDWNRRGVSGADQALRNRLLETQADHSDLNISNCLRDV